jgi:crotonobetainyl-CoA:carnitine CoA-transferase CaiB-like acyl-CoA transferase
MPGPLEGVRVLDFSRVLAGPHCGRMLVDLGADVIKVEPPEGDMSRFATPRVNSLSASYVQQNCGKRNVSLDLDRPEARELLVRLVAHADVVLENFRPGVMERLGLSYARLSAANPRLVYASITGYGQSGPWSDRRAYAPLVAAEVGFLELFARFRKLEIRQEVYSHADLYAALECLSAIVAALYQRERSGRGQQVEIAMAEALLCVNEFAGGIFSGFDPDGSRLPATVASPVFETAAGRKISVGGDPLVRDNFHGWCRAMEREDLRADPRFADADGREAHRAELIAAISDWVGGFRDLDALGRRLEAAGLTYGIVRTVAEIGDSEWAKARGAVVEVSDRGSGVFRIPNSPWRFSEASSGVRGEPAYRGEHNREVFGSLLGLSAAELDALEQRGVLVARGPST